LGKLSLVLVADVDLPAERMGLAEPVGQNNYAHTMRLLLKAIAKRRSGSSLRCIA